MKSIYSVNLNQDDDGAWVAEVEELPGCIASGFTPGELEEALIEAISMYMSTEDFRFEFEPRPGQLAEALSLGRRSLELVGA